MRLALWAAALVLGLMAGVGSALWTLDHGAPPMEIDGWRFNPLAGAPAADAYGRAIVARNGLLALAASEAIYFERGADEQGRKLDEACEYEISGGPLPSRWWSLTLYARDNYLPRGGDRAFSIDATRAKPDRSGRWAVRIAAARGDADYWISSRNARAGFALMLRLYQPEQDARLSPRDIPLPQMRTISCPGDAP